MSGPCELSVSVALLFTVQGHGAYEMRNGRKLKKWYTTSIKMCLKTCQKIKPQASVMDTEKLWLL